MCVTTTFVYDCGHKHLVRLSCARHNDFLCGDLSSRRLRRHYQCCCCIEYEMNVAAQTEEHTASKQVQVQAWMECVHLTENESEHGEDRKGGSGDVRMRDSSPG
ncbi:unnamed protein product [Diplocarpon coronariae]